MIVLALWSALAAEPVPAPFASCEAIETHVRQIRRDRRDAALFGLLGKTTPLYGTDGTEGSSTTLLQEPDVDEADRIRVVGPTLFAVHPGGVAVVDLDRGQVVATVALQDVHGLLGGDGVLVAITEDGRAAIVDVSDPGAPRLVRAVGVEGRVRAARRIGDQLVLVTTSKPKPRAKADLWRPALTEARGGSVRAVPTSCADVSYTPDLRGPLHRTTIATIDLADASAPPRAVALLGPADAVYASPDAVWIAQVGRGDPFRGRGSDDTVIHRVTVDDGPAWSLTATLPGRLPGRTALSERDGVLRAALTDPAGLTTSVRTWRVGPTLVPLGATPELAPGETATGARFVGDTAFLVTFRVERGDPLFVVDLSDPSAPAVRSELHVPGWADQLQPVDDGTLLAVGMDFDGTRWYPAVSVFDVHDPDAPALLDRVLLQVRDTPAREELWAWTWHPETGLLALPTRGGSVAGLEVLRLRDGRLEPLGFARASRPPDQAVLADGALWFVDGTTLRAVPADDPDAAGRSWGLPPG